MTRENLLLLVTGTETPKLTKSEKIIFEICLRIINEKEAEISGLKAENDNLAGSTHWLI
jgi:hypothetical protein